jgi:hypothetical protein
MQGSIGNKALFSKWMWSLWDPMEAHLKRDLVEKK